MLAVVFSSHGGPEVLGLADVADPTPAAHEVRVKVRATALNRADLLQRRGKYPPPPGASDILGLECAGTVEQLGPGASRFAVGDRVMALLAGGGYAEQVVVHEGSLLPIPARLSFEQAAAVPEAFLTASEALFAEGELTGPGQSVLITAAAGGVGSAAVQIAKLHGARVIASASPGKLARVESLGADVLIERDQPDYVESVTGATGGRGVDVIVDFIGASALARHQACLAPKGRLVVVGLLGGAAAPLDLGRLLMKRQRILGLVMRSRSVEEKAAIVARFRRQLWPALDAAALSPHVDQTFPLAEAARAHAHMEANRNTGKIVLTVG